MNLSAIVLTGWHSCYTNTPFINSRFQSIFNLSQNSCASKVFLFQNRNTFKKNITKKETNTCSLQKLLFILRLFTIGCLLITIPCQFSGGDFFISASEKVPGLNTLMKNNIEATRLYYLNRVSLTFYRMFLYYR